MVSPISAQILQLVVLFFLLLRKEYSVLLFLSFLIFSENRHLLLHELLVSYNWWDISLVIIPHHHRLNFFSFRTFIWFRMLLDVFFLVLKTRFFLLLTTKSSLSYKIISKAIHRFGSPQLSCSNISNVPNHLAYLLFFFLYLYSKFITLKLLILRLLLCKKVEKTFIVLRGTRLLLKALRTVALLRL